MYADNRPADAAELLVPVAGVWKFISSTHVSTYFHAHAQIVP
ncbi:hypothetical protein [Streptomyces sp. NPDC002825]